MTLTILLIDDDRRVLEIFGRNLKMLGYQPLLTHDSQEALRLYDEHHPDIVMVDLRMPQMDGLEVLRAIRARDPTAEVILVTAYGDSDDVISALRAGVSDFVPKPLDEAALEGALQRAVGRLAMRRDLHVTQAALRESETRFRITLKNAPVVVAHIDPQLRYTWVYNTFPGTSESAMIGQTDDALLDFEGGQTLMALKRAALDAGEVTHTEVRIRYNDATFYYDVTLDSLRTAEDEIGGMTMVAVDITARKVAEESLRRDHDLLNRLMETTPLGITVVDRQGNITFANGPAEQILGLTRAEITTRTYNDPGWQITDFQGAPLPDTALPFARVVMTGEPIYDARHAIVWPNGRRVLLSMHGAPLTDAHGELDGVVFTLADVTERVREEERRIEELERELSALTVLAAVPQTTITARMFGVKSLHESLPDVYAALCHRYGEVLEYTIEQRLYQVEFSTSDALRELAQRLGQLQVGPRDVMEIHTRVLQEKCAEVNLIKARAYAAEGRLTALELMGYLVSYYRARCAGVIYKRAEPGGADA